MPGTSSTRSKRHLQAGILIACLTLAVLTVSLSAAGCSRVDKDPAGVVSDILNRGKSAVDQAIGDDNSGDNAGDNAGSNDSGGTVAKDLKWTYDGKRFTWQVEVPGQLLDWDRNVNRLTAEFYNSKFSQAAIETMSAEYKQLVLADSVQEGGDLAPWVNDTHNSQWTGNLANQLSASARRNGFDYFRTAEFIQSFVCGAIPYQNTFAPELPAQTLMDNGDCKDKSILLAALLESLSYKVTLLEFSPQDGDPGHMAVGVAFTDAQVPSNRDLSYYRYKGRKYYFAETTAPDWPLGAASVKEPAHVYDVN